MVTDLSVDRVVSCLKRFGAESLERKGGVSGINVAPAARALVNDIERYPHAFVLACIADRQTKSDIAWRLPHAIREAAKGFEVDTLRRLPKSAWASVLASSGHRLASEMERLLPAAIGHIGDRYGGDASRIWANGSSGAAVARRFLAFDGVGPKIANMAVNILVRDFGIHLTRPMPDIAVDTHVLRVFERLGLLGRSITASYARPGASSSSGSSCGLANSTRSGPGNSTGQHGLSEEPGVTPGAHPSATHAT